MIDASLVPQSHVRWRGAVRIIRSAFPPVDLFEDIADPADWPLLIAAEQKTNPRLMDSIGELDRVPPGRQDPVQGMEAPGLGRHVFSALGHLLDDPPPE